MTDFTRRNFIKTGGAALIAVAAASFPSNAEAAAPVAIKHFNHTPEELKEAAKNASATSQATSEAANAGTDAAAGAATQQAKKRFGLGNVPFVGGALERGRESIVESAKDHATNPAKGVSILLAKDSKESGGTVFQLFGTDGQGTKLANTITASKLTDATIIVVDADNVNGKKSKDVAEGVAGITASYKDEGTPLVIVVKASDPSVILLAKNLAGITVDDLNKLASAAPAAGPKPEEKGKPAQPEEGARRRRAAIDAVTPESGLG
jgi:hypothetical protein